MANFLTRVELHGATWDDYEQLHSEMSSRGFSREIVADDGRTYQLPTAEYVSHGTLSLTDVRALAVEAATATGRRFGVIVAEFVRSGWQGLTYA
jgi:hypothetical protein